MPQKSRSYVTSAKADSLGDATIQKLNAEATDTWTQTPSKLGV